MSDIATTAGDDPRIDSRVLAEHLGLRHQNVFEQLKDYRANFDELGLLRFETGKATGGRPPRFAMLNEDQCYLLLAFSRNTPQVRALKVKLVKAFREARQARDTLNLEYLPTYHELHDRIDLLAAESSNKKFVHMNVNKLINKTVGIGSGQRPSLSFPQRSLVATAQTLAAGAMQGAQDHHDGYEAAKEVLGTLGKALSMSQKGEAQAGESARASVNNPPGQR